MFLQYFSLKNGVILLYDQLQNEKQFGATALCLHSCWAELKSLKWMAASEESNPQGWICSNVTIAQVRTKFVNINPKINFKLLQKHFQPLLTAVSIKWKANMRSNYVPLGYNKDWSPHWYSEDKNVWLSCCHSDCGGTRKGLFEREGTLVYTYFASLTYPTI